MDIWTALAISATVSIPVGLVTARLAYKYHIKQLHKAAQVVIMDVQRKYAHRDAA